MLRRSRRRLRRRARRARPKPVLAQALPRRWSHPPRRRGPRRARSARPGPHLEEPRGPPAEVWVAVPAASKARAGRRRQGQRRQEVAVVAAWRGRHPRGRARWAVVQVRRGLALGREAAWEPKAAQPTGCWRAVRQGRCLRRGARGLTACGCPGRIRRRRATAGGGRMHRRTARRTSAWTDDDKGELGLLMPGEPEGPPTAWCSSMARK